MLQEKKADISFHHLDRNNRFLANLIDRYVSRIMRKIERIQPILGIQEVNLLSRFGQPVVQMFNCS